MTPVRDDRAAALPTWLRRAASTHRTHVLGALAALVIIAAPVPPQLRKPVERQVSVEAASFAFTPAVIRVNRGDRVTLDLIATDMVHGLYLDGYGIDVTAEPGKTETLTFVADRAGTFRFRCSVTCGALHPFMIGRLHVGSNTLLWRASALALLAIAVGFAESRR
jgi:heme/copper-type cytochrome/quinol oxidase subunit 2